MRARVKRGAAGSRSRLLLTAGDPLEHDVDQLVVEPQRLARGDLDLGVSGRGFAHQPRNVLARVAAGRQEVGMDDDPRSCAPLPVT